MSFFRDLRIAFYSLTRTKGLAITVLLTLALGIGANAAMFTLVRGVLLKPLVNRDEDRLIYIRQSATGITRIATRGIAAMKGHGRLLGPAWTLLLGVVVLVAGHAFFFNCLRHAGVSLAVVSDLVDSHFCHDPAHSLTH